MKRREFLWTVGMGAATLALPKLGPAAGGAGRKPNLVIILADDLGYGDVGCYGCKTIKTPHIDAMAADGLKFTDFHSNGAVCSPTRAALLTGRYQQRCGVTGVVTARRHRDKGMALNEVTFAEVLRAAGYATGIFGKWHVGYDPKFSPVRQGFDEFVGFVSGNVDYHSHVDQVGYLDWWKARKIENEPGYTTDLLTDYGVRFIEKYKDRPFCLYLPHGAPHYPYQGRKSRPGRAVTQGPFAGTVKLPDADDPAYAKQTPAERYREMIEVLDEGVGEIRSTLKKLGLEKDTLVVFFSDNGPTGPGSAGPLRGKKGQVWEGGHRVPAVMVWPGTIPPGRVTDQTAMGMDLFATMLAAAGIDPPTDRKLDGVSLLDLAKTGKPLAPRRLFWDVAKGRAVRKGPWKLVQTGKAGGGQLFNLTDDLGEKTDVAGKHPEIVKELTAALDAWRTDVSKDAPEVS